MKTGNVPGVSLAGKEPHYVPVSGENTELHQVPEHTEYLQQELLEAEGEGEEEKVGGRGSCEEKLRGSKGQEDKGEENQEYEEMS